MTDDTELDEILTRCFSNYSDEVAYHIAEDIAEAKQALLAWSERRENIEYHNGEKSGYADWQYLLDEELGIKAETPEQAVAAIKEREAAAPTENTGDEGLRHTKTTDKVLDIIDNGDSNRYAVALRISNWHDALIRQDRQELFEQGVRAGWNKSGEGYNAEFSYPNPEKTEDTVVRECIAELDND